MGLKTDLPISWAMSSGSRAKRPPLPPSPPYALGMVNADYDPWMLYEPLMNLEQNMIWYSVQLNS